MLSREAANTNFKVFGLTGDQNHDIAESTITLLRQFLMKWRI